jgi:hypothetical protein
MLEFDREFMCPISIFWAASVVSLVMGLRSSLWRRARHFSRTMTDLALCRVYARWAMTRS